jgi:hypothetical protein
MASIPNAFAHSSSSDPKRDWRVAMALASTALWLILGFSYIAIQIGWQAFLRQPVDALGGFLEGAFAPLAFLWLVVGSFLQQRELRQNNIAIQAQYEEMRRTADNSAVQARAIEANALHQQQETTLIIADRVQRQIGSTMGMLWMSSQASSPADRGEPGESRAYSLWNQHGAGDPESFAREMMALYFTSDDPEGARDLFFGTEIRGRHSRSIRSAFEGLLELVRRCDPDGVIEEAVRGGGNGRIYQLICDLDTPPDR